MDDLLQRMLAIDREAEKLIQEAEAEAAKMAEAVRLEINLEREKAQAALVTESDHIYQEAIAKSKLAVEQELEQSIVQLQGELEAFDARIRQLQPELLRALLSGS